MANENEPAPEVPRESEPREPKDQRIPIMMSVSELKAIDDWMFSNRIRSRAEAIRRLCQLGMVFDVADILNNTNRMIEGQGIVVALMKVIADIAERNRDDSIYNKMSPLHDASNIFQSIIDRYVAMLNGIGAANRQIDDISKFVEHYRSTSDQVANHLEKFGEKQKNKSSKT